MLVCVCCLHGVLVRVAPNAYSQNWRICAVACVCKSIRECVRSLVCVCVSVHGHGWGPCTYCDDDIIDESEAHMIADSAQFEL